MSINNFAVSGKLFLERLFVHNYYFNKFILIKLAYKKSLFKSFKNGRNSYSPKLNDFSKFNHVFLNVKIQIQILPFWQVLKKCVFL